MREKACVMGFHGERSGESGIRTHGTFVTFSGFQDRRIQALCHLSTWCIRFI